MSARKSGSDLTPVSELFTYHIFGYPRQHQAWQEDISTYTLEVTGLVSTPLTLTLHQIQEDFEPAEAYMILECMTRIHWGKIKVKGARVLDVLERAGIQESVTKAAFHSADGFDTDLTIKEIRENPQDFLLAYEINDKPLTLNHGFPLRMAANEKYGYKWPKWLIGIELVDYDYKGHYEGRRGWSDKGIRGKPVI